jgi:hypothetical protein
LQAHITQGIRRRFGKAQKDASTTAADVDGIRPRFGKALKVGTTAARANGIRRRFGKAQKDASTTLAGGKAFAGGSGKH